MSTVMQADTLLGSLGWAPLQEAHRLWSWQLPFYGVLLVAALALMLVDDRTLFDISVWVKPAKFSLSLAVFYGTLAWIAAFLPPDYFRSREGRALTWVAIVPGALEIVYIFLMAGLGQPSHYNTTTTLTNVLYGLMGFGAVTLVLCAGWLASAVWRRCANWWQDPLLLTIVLGLIMTLVLGGGFGIALSRNDGGHWVGGERTDANGLALFGWSTTGGDLRVAHFFGMHAMQVLPALGWLLRGSRVGIPAVLLTTLLYGALSVYTFLQGRGARPFLQL